MTRTQRALVVEGGINHTNLGVIFRSAAALGMDGVFLSPSCVDPLYHRCVPVGCAIVFGAVRQLEPWPKALAEVRSAGFSLVALTPGPDAVDVRSIPERAQRRRPALLLGAEGPGLTEGALAAAEYRARIPMHHGVDSLNVGVAAAIACYEFSRGVAPVSA